MPDTDEKVPLPDGAEMRPMSVSDLIRLTNHTAAKLGKKHRKTRVILFNCAFALKQLADRLAKAEGEEGRIQ